MIDRLLEIARSNAADALASEMDDSNDPVEMASAAGELVKKLYREYKDVEAMLAAGTAGVAYCERRAATQSNEHERWELLRSARAIAFNTAANCWPGWDDPGITIERSQIVRALELARRSEAIARDLSLPARKMGGAIWLVGALHLALGEPNEARASFERAEGTFTAAQDSAAYALMARGYIALAGAANPLSHEDGEQMLLATIEQLRADGSNDALFFIEQLLTAKRVFAL
jgi:hypothetical protein